MIEDFIFYLQDDIEMYINTDWRRASSDTPASSRDVACSQHSSRWPDGQGDPKVSTNGSPSKSSILGDPTFGTHHISYWSVGYIDGKDRRVKSYQKRSKTWIIMIHFCPPLWGNYHLAKPLVSIMNHFHFSLSYPAPCMPTTTTWHNSLGTVQSLCSKFRQ